MHNMHIVHTNPAGIRGADLFDEDSTVNDLIKIVISLTQFQGKAGKLIKITIYAQPLDQLILYRLAGRVVCICRWAQ